MIKPIAAMIALICATAAWGAGAEKPIVWDTPTLQFTLASPGEGMGLLGIHHVARGVEFMKRPESAGRALLWRIELTADRSDPKALITLDNTAAAQCSVRRVPDGLILSWQGVKLPEGGGTLDVTVRAKTGGPNGFTDWRIDVANQSSRYGIWRVMFPVMELGKIGDSGADDYLICSPAEGRSVRNPIGLKPVANGPKMPLSDDTDPVADKSQTSAQYGFGAAWPNGLPYPSGRGQMQLSAYYQKRGSFYYSSASRGPGLYFTPQDGQLNPKLFFYTPDAGRGVLTCQTANFPTDQGKPGLDYHMSYPMVIGGFEGDWYDAAHLYRQWALQQTWASRGPLAERKDIPDWLKGQVGTFRMDIKRGKNESLMPFMREARQQLPGVWMAQWYDWSSAEKGDAKGYAFPPTADAPSGFGKLVEALQANRIEVFPYMNTRLWRTDRPDYSKVKKYVKQNADGTLAVTSYGGAHMCVQTDFWRDYLAKVAAEIVRRYHPAGLYLDQAGGASFGGVYDSNGCFDPNHGHPLGTTRQMVQAEHDRMGAILKATQKIEPKIVLSGEASSEVLVDVLANKLIHYEIWPGYVPLYSAVYHDYQTSYGRTASLVAKNPKDPKPQMQIGWQLVIGNQIGRVWESVFREKYLSLPVVQRNLDYLRRAAQVRQRWAAFLCTGQMLRPPVLLSQVPTVTTHEFRGKHACSLPGVLASVWKSADGGVALVATNISDQSLDVRFGLAKALMGKGGVQQVYPTTGPVRIESAGEGATVKLHLDPLEIRVLVWGE